MTSTFIAESPPADRMSRFGIGVDLRFTPRGAMANGETLALEIGFQGDGVVFPRPGHFQCVRRRLGDLQGAIEGRSGISQAHHLQLVEHHGALQSRGYHVVA